MNNQKEFRAWDTYEKCYIKFFYIDEYGNFIHEDGEPNADVLIEQWTGLKDKNGVKIFEGDIVSSNDYSNGVFFTDNHPKKNSVIIFDRGEFRFNNTCGSIKTSKSIEVIGNINEDKHLLEEVKK